ncbi:MAG: nucleotidyltransferase domain-containing protein [Spirochaetota bacterium]
MDKIPDSIKSLINRYMAALAKSGIDIDTAFLFGSYSRGTFNEFSDIDIALVSKSFSGNRIKDRDKIRKHTLSISSMIEVIPFSVDDFNELNPFAKEIIKTGIQII